MYNIIGRKECDLEVRAYSQADIYVLMCVATDYHGLVQNQWYKDGKAKHLDNHADNAFCVHCACQEYSIYTLIYHNPHSCEKLYIYNSILSINIILHEHITASGSGERLVSCKVEHHQTLSHKDVVVTHSESNKSLTTMIHDNNYTN